jgi:hypothetical protein
VKPRVPGAKAALSPAVILLALCVVSILVLGCSPSKQAASTTSETYVRGGLDPAVADLVGEARAAGLQIGIVATSEA